MDMRVRLRWLMWTGLAALLASLAGATLRANGAEFFEAQNDGRVVLYYFGNIKDSKGNPVDKVMVTIKAADMTFPFRNDSPGHFRSPDIGRSLEGVGKKVDPAQVQVTITKKDYKLVKAPKVPAKLGAVDLGLFVMDPVE
jgi:hypothetical protein